MQSGHMNAYIWYRESFIIFTETGAMLYNFVVSGKQPLSNWAMYEYYCLMMVSNESF
jgi:hypothetical protein